MPAVVGMHRGALSHRVLPVSHPTKEASLSSSSLPSYRSHTGVTWQIDTALHELCVFKSGFKLLRGQDKAKRRGIIRLSDRRLPTHRRLV